MTIHPDVVDVYKDAERYRWLRARDRNAIEKGGVFAGQTPQDIVLTEFDLDREIDEAMAAERKTFNGPPKSPLARDTRWEVTNVSARCPVEEIAIEWPGLILCLKQDGTWYGLIQKGNGRYYRTKMAEAQGAIDEANERRRKRLFGDWPHKGKD